ncbi:MAG: thioredoxin family protein [Thermoanaerobaculia bacterium]|nr:MAG: thioredoxin family protein [Thermoanaerobaculia bacterium]MBZ0101981.1 thioredoxin family protein [Thermoanaerobaculia bacterium]
MSRTSLRPLLPAFALLLLACTGPTLAEVAVGQPAPDFRLLDLDGNAVSLSSFADRTVVLEWINPNCPFSLRHADEKTMQTTATRHPEVVWLAVNSTRPDHGDHLDPAAWKTFLAERGITYPVLADPDGASGRAWGARTTPHMFVIDKGKIAYMGAIDDDPRGSRAATERQNYVDAALVAIAAGKPVATPSTRPYGCSVKY